MTSSRSHDDLLNKIFDPVLLNDPLPKERYLKKLGSLLQTKEIWSLLPPNKSILYDRLKGIKDDNKMGMARDTEMPARVLLDIIKGIEKQYRESADSAANTTKNYFFPKKIENSVLTPLFKIIDSEKDEQAFIKLFSLACDALKYVEEKNRNYIYPLFFYGIGVEYSNCLMFTGMRKKDIDQSTLFLACSRLLNSHDNLVKFLRELLFQTLNRQINLLCLPTALIALSHNRDNKGTLEDLFEKPVKYFFFHERINFRSTKKFEAILKDKLGIAVACEILYPLLKADLLPHKEYSSEYKNAMFKYISNSCDHEMIESLRDIEDLSSSIGCFFSKKENYVVFKGKRAVSESFRKKASQALLVDEVVSKAASNLTEQLNKMRDVRKDDSSEESKEEKSSSSSKTKK